ncbi:MAG: hypothetical protein ABTR07_02615 [Candidatus Competibacter denitrificans]
MNEQPDALHDEHLSALYRAIPQVEPPEWLDRRVLLAAKATVQPSAPRPAAIVPKRHPSRWAVPLALAATVVLSVGVVRLVRESGELATAPSLESTQVVTSPAGQANAEPSGASQALSAEEKAQPRAAASAPAPSAPATSPIIPPSLAPPAPLADRLLPAESSAHPVDAKPTGSGQPPSFSRQMKEAEKRDEAPTRARKERSKTEEKQLFRNSPERWLREIAELRRQGETMKAEAEWLEFKRRYPHYPLDPSEADSNKR